jgi:hypothetical protein
MTSHDTLIDACFRASPDVRYVAAYLDGTLALRSRDDIAQLGSNESDRYEELIVNPTLIKLLTQRGDIDCGGLVHVVVRYGTFFAYIQPVPGGHVTISFELHAAIDEEVPRLREVIAGLTGAALAGGMP